VPSTFIATVEAIAATGAKPVLVDVDPATRCMDPERVAAAITPETAAVVPVHLYGRPAPVEAIRAAAGDVPLLEDAAQAHGASLDGRRTGALGSAAGFSFYPTKNLGALGDGGAVVTDDADVAATVRSLRHHGAAEGDANDHIRAGATSRLDNLQAALLSVKLPHLDDWNRQRREAAALYREALAGLPVELPPEDPAGGDQVFHLFAVELDDRDRVRAELREGGVGVAVHYPRPAHLNPAWSELGSPGDFPAAERLAGRTLSLPMFPGIEEREIEQVGQALAAACGSR
jgi:dTDP-4-amino-4,6-dideoxygalactose transaminase